MMVSFSVTAQIRRQPQETSRAGVSYRLCKSARQ